jgi:acyl-CoA thioesterase-1
MAWPRVMPTRRSSRPCCALRAGAYVQNAGVSGDTSASALARLPRLLSSLSRVPDLAVVALGANDLLRGMSLQQTRSNLDAIIGELARCGIPVLIAAMEAPRFLGGFARACDAVYSDLAAKHGVPAWPFFPAGVLGNRALTLSDVCTPMPAPSQWWRSTCLFLCWTP